jgi:site-specific DNA-methyltransferase (adenine-specific)
MSNHHPTVKPLALMRWLVRLVTPPGGVVLDPFAGSGTTLAAAVLEGFDAVGIEMTDEYLPIINGRVAWAEQQVANKAPTLFTEEAS